MPAAEVDPWVRLPVWAPYLWPRIWRERWERQHPEAEPKVWDDEDAEWFSVETVEVDDDPPPHTPAMLAAGSRVVADAEVIQRAILEAVHAAYPTYQEWYRDDPEQLARHAPDVAGMADFTALIGLGSIHIHRTERDGLAYVGYLFSCSWDDEHGLGVLTHGSSVVSVGGADTSFLWWIADEHAKSAR